MVYLSVFHKVVWDGIQGVSDDNGPTRLALMRVIVQSVAGRHEFSYALLTPDVLFPTEEYLLDVTKFAHSENLADRIAHTLDK